MPRFRVSYWLPILAGGLLLAGAALLWPPARVEAQCGSQASSCKNCHEVQGQMAVNNDGTGWHQSHAFGDFCANCHAGNVQATDAAAAHAGMVAPLSDLQANCAACHPDDTAKLGQVYAAALGIEIGAGGASGGGSGGTAGTPAPTPPPAATAAPLVVDGSTPGLIDYNRQYATTVEGKLDINWGNVILGALIVLLAAGGGAFVYFNEMKLRGGRPRKPKAAPVLPGPALEAAGLRPEVAELLPQLERLDPRGLRALKRILESPEAAGDLLFRVSRLDPQLVAEVRELDRGELSLLVALAEER